MSTETCTLEKPNHRAVVACAHFAHQLTFPAQGARVGTHLVELEELMANGHGGKRANTGGSKSGRRWPATLEKAMVKEETRKFIQQHMPAMLRSQIAHAIGIGHLFTRDAHGKFTRIIDEKEMERLLTEGTENTDYWIFAKDPSVQAFSELLNRTLDQAPKPVEVSGPGGSAIVVRWED